MEQLLAEGLEGFVHYVACDNDVWDFRVRFVDLSCIKGFEAHKS